MVVEPIRNDCPAVETNFVILGVVEPLPAGLGFGAIAADCGSGALLVAFTGPAMPGKQMMARNQCECSLIGMMR